MKRSPFALVLALAGQMGHAAQGLPAVAAGTTLFTGLSAARVHAAPVSAPEVVEQWLLPRYDALRAAAGAQKTAWEAFCAKPPVAGVAELKTRFAAVSEG